MRCVSLSLVEEPSPVILLHIILITAVEKTFLRSDDHAAVSVQSDFTLEVVISVIGYPALEPQRVGLHVAHHEVYVKMTETTRPYSAHGTHANHAEGIHPIGRWRQETNSYAMSLCYTGALSSFGRS